MKAEYFNQSETMRHKRKRCVHLLRNADEIKRKKRQGLNYGRTQPERCSREAAYIVDGVQLCSLHAGDVALNHLMRKSGG